MSSAATRQVSYVASPRHRCGILLAALVLLVLFIGLGSVLLATLTEDWLHVSLGDIPAFNTNETAPPPPINGTPSTPAPTEGVATDIDKRLLYRTSDVATNIDIYLSPLLYCMNGVCNTRRKHDKRGLLAFQQCNYSLGNKTFSWDEPFDHERPHFVYRNCSVVETQWGYDFGGVSDVDRAKGLYEGSIAVLVLAIFFGIMAFVAAGFMLHHMQAEYEVQVLIPNENATLMKRKSSINLTLPIGYINGEEGGAGLGGRRPSMHNITVPIPEEDLVKVQKSHADAADYIEGKIYKEKVCSYVCIICSALGCISTIVSGYLYYEATDRLSSCEYLEDTYAQWLPSNAFVGVGLGCDDGMGYYSAIVGFAAFGVAVLVAIGIAIFLAKTSRRADMRLMQERLATRYTTAARDRRRESLEGDHKKLNGPAQSILKKDTASMRKKRSALSKFEFPMEESMMFESEEEASARGSTPPSSRKKRVCVNGSDEEMSSRRSSSGATAATTVARSAVDVGAVEGSHAVHFAGGGRDISPGSSLTKRTSSRRSRSNERPPAASSGPSPQQTVINVNQHSQESLMWYAKLLEEHNILMFEREGVHRLWTMGQESLFRVRYLQWPMQKLRKGYKLASLHQFFLDSFYGPLLDINRAETYAREHIAEFKERRAMMQLLDAFAIGCEQIQERVPLFVGYYVKDAQEKEEEERHRRMKQPNSRVVDSPAPLGRIGTAVFSNDHLPPDVDLVPSGDGDGRRPAFSVSSGDSEDRYLNHPDTFYGIHEAFVELMHIDPALVHGDQDTSGLANGHVGQDDDGHHWVPAHAYAPPTQQEQETFFDSVGEPGWITATSSPYKRERDSPHHLPSSPPPMGHLPAGVTPEHTQSPHYTLRSSTPDSQARRGGSAASQTRYPSVDKTGTLRASTGSIPSLSVSSDSDIDVLSPKQHLGSGSHAAERRKKSAKSMEKEEQRRHHNDPHSHVEEQYSQPQDGVQYQHHQQPTASPYYNGAVPPPVVYGPPPPQQFVMTAYGMMPAYPPAVPQTQVYPPPPPVAAGYASPYGYGTQQMPLATPHAQPNGTSPYDVPPPRPGSSSTGSQYPQQYPASRGAANEQSRGSVHESPSRRSRTRGERGADRQQPSPTNRADLDDDPIDAARANYPATFGRKSAEQDQAPTYYKRRHADSPGKYEAPRGALSPRAGSSSHYGHRSQQPPPSSATSSAVSSPFGTSNPYLRTNNYSPMQTRREEPARFDLIGDDLRRNMGDPSRTRGGGDDDVIRGNGGYNKRAAALDDISVGFASLASRTSAEVLASRSNLSDLMLLDMNTNNKSYGPDGEPAFSPVQGGDDTDVTNDESVNVTLHSPGGKKGQRQSAAAPMDAIERDLALLKAEAKRNVSMAQHANFFPGSYFTSAPSSSAMNTTSGGGAGPRGAGRDGSVRTPERQTYNNRDHNDDGGQSNPVDASWGQNAVESRLATLNGGRR